MANNLSYDRHKCLLVTLVHGLRGSPPYRGGVVCGSSTPGWAEDKTLSLHKPEALCAIDSKRMGEVNACTLHLYDL